MNQSTIIYGARQSKYSDQFSHVIEEDFQILTGEESFGIALDVFNKIQQIPINGKTLPELFSFDDCSIWWFLHQTLYPEMKKLTNFIKKFSEFLEKNNVKKIIVVGQFENFKIINQICKNKNIELVYSKIDFSKFKILTSSKNKIQKIRYEKIFSQKISKRKNIFNSLKNELPKIQNQIVFAIPSIYHRGVVDVKTGKSFNGEYIQQEIMNNFETSELIGIDIDYTFSGDYDVLSERLNSDVSWVPIEFFLKDTSKFQNFLEKYNKIIANVDFQHLFNFQGISLWANFSKIFQQFVYAPYLPNYLNLIDSLDLFFQHTKPKIVFLSYETGPYGQAIIIACKKNNIKTVGVAHATIDKNNPMYSYTRLKTNSDPYGFPIPDFTLVHGQFSKSTMVDIGYPSNQILVYGNTVFFNLEKIREHLEHANLKQKYNISSKKSVILYATEFLQEMHSTQGRYNYNSLVFKKLLDQFSNDEKYEIILKPHPNENTEIYEKILNSYSPNNVQIIQGNLFELLHMSSLVIAIFSNVLTDALCFEKPVIRVTFDNIEHTVPYQKYGVVLSTSLENLNENIENILNDDELQKSLKKNLHAFLKEQNNIPEVNPKKILNYILEN